MACNGLRQICGATGAMANFAGATGVSARSLLGGKLASQNNRFMGETTLYKGDGTPSGYSPMYSWYPNIKTGGMGSRYQVVGVAGTGLSKLYAGRNMPASLTGVATITASGTRIFVEDMLADIIGSATFTPTGQLLVDAVCLLGILGEGTVTATLLGKLDGIINAVGSGDITAALGALGGMVADIIGSGTMEGIPYAKGYLEAAILSYSTLSPENMAAAVWNSIVADFQSSGSTGKALSSAGSAGDPWSGIMAGYTDDATFGAFVKKLLTTSKFIGLK